MSLWKDNFCHFQAPQARLTVSLPPHLNTHTLTRSHVLWRFKLNYYCQVCLLAKQAASELAFRCDHYQLSKMQKKIVLGRPRWACTWCELERSMRETRSNWLCFHLHLSSLSLSLSCSVVDKQDGGREWRPFERGSENECKSEKVKPQRGAELCFARRTATKATPLTN